MSDALRFYLSLTASLGCGIIGGVFFAFSTFVMKALGRLPAMHGIAAMQSINRVVLTPWFLGVFVGTALLCLALAVVAAAAWRLPQSAYIMSGSLAYVIGTFGVTRAANIPLNDALARVEAASAEGARVWAHYLARWTRWNHVRTVAALMAAVLFMLALER